MVTNAPASRPILVFLPSACDLETLRIFLLFKSTFNHSQSPGSFSQYLKMVKPYSNKNKQETNKKPPKTSPVIIHFIISLQWELLNPLQLVVIWLKFLYGPLLIIKFNLSISVTIWLYILCHLILLATPFYLKLSSFLTSMAVFCPPALQSPLLTFRITLFKSFLLKYS